MITATKTRYLQKGLAEATGSRESSGPQGANLVYCDDQCSVRLVKQLSRVQNDKLTRRKTQGYLCDRKIQSDIDDDCEEQDVESSHHQQGLLQHEHLIECVVHLGEKQEDGL